MKKFLITLLLAFIIKAGIAQNYNPNVNSGIMNPSPLFNGVGSCQFTVGNTGNDALDNLAQPMVLTISLSYGVPNNVDPIAAISGTYANMFNWRYDASTKTYQGTQNKIMPGVKLGTIKIAYRVTTFSNFLSPKNGFNVNITPPAYTNSSNAMSDDNVSSYTYASYTLPPVKLACFNATANNCISSVNWKSYTEANFCRYEVEFSKDGTKFSSIAQVNGKGDNSEYSLTYNSGQGIAYYRLKLVYNDGKFQYSNVISLNVVCNLGCVSVYPNPAIDLINVNITGASKEGKMVQLLNNLGQVMVTKILPNGTSQIDISGMASGIYQLKVLNSTGNEFINIIKK